MTAPGPAMPHPAPDGPATAAGGAALRRAATSETLGIVGAPFALAAKLVESAGFDAIYLSGAAYSAGHLGVPDIGLFTREQLVEQTRILARAVTIPLVVDADTGFGGPREVEACVQRLESAGAAAIVGQPMLSSRACHRRSGSHVGIHHTGKPNLRHSRSVCQHSVLAPPTLPG